MRSSAAADTPQRRTRGPRGGGRSAPRRDTFAALVGAALTLAGTAQSVACPPPPPPAPTVEQQARAFWDRVDRVCVVRLDRTTLSESDLPALQVYGTMAQGRWQVAVAPLEALKGDCAPGMVHFVDIPPVLCGGGMPDFDTVLVAGWSADRVMAVWTPADGALGLALRVRAGVARR